MSDSSSSSSSASSISRLSEIRLLRATWTPETEVEAAESMKNNAEMVRLQRDIQGLHKRLGKLRQSQNLRIWQSALPFQPGLWEKLPKALQWKPENVLAVYENPMIQNCFGCALPEQLCEPLQLPKHLQNHIKVWHARLGTNHCKLFYSKLAPPLPQRLKHEPEILRRLLKYYPSVTKHPDWVWKSRDLYHFYIFECPHQNLYRKFDGSLRNDPHLNNPTGSPFGRIAYHLKNCHVNSNRHHLLRNNTEYAVRIANTAVQIPANALTCLSRRLRDDSRVVRAFCSVNPRTLAHASTRLRRDAAFCDMLPVASLSFAIRPNYTRDRVVAYLELPTTTISKKLGARMVQAFPKDADIVTLAWKHQIASAPTAGVRWGEVLQANSGALWKNIPRKHRRAEHVLCLQSPRILREALRQFPHAAESPLFLPHLAGLGQLSEFPEYLPDNWGLEHKQMVITSIAGGDSELYELLDGTVLESDREVVEAAVRLEPETIMEVTEVVQFMYPELVAEAIVNYDDDIWDIYHDIPEELFSNRQVALAWLSQGGDYLHDEFPDDFEQDKELFLTIAEHAPHDFWCCDESLCNDKEFMKRVIAKTPSLLREASKTLRFDLDLALVAFGNPHSVHLADHYNSKSPAEFQFLVRLAEEVRHELTICENFQVFVECSTGSRLDQGDEMLAQFHDRIKGLAGVPDGERLQQLQQASANLAVWGY